MKGADERGFFRNFGFRQVEYSEKEVENQERDCCTSPYIILSLQPAGPRGKESSRKESWLTIG